MSFVLSEIPAFPGVDLAGNSIYRHFVTLASGANLNEPECESARFAFRINKLTLRCYCVLHSHPLCLLSWTARQLLILVCEAV